MLNVVMLAKDRPRLTNQAIESLMANTQSQFSLTLVDDHSNDPQAIRLLSKWEERYPLFRWIHNGEWMGSGWSRNRGVQISESIFGRGDYLVLSDNDAYFAPHWDTVLLQAAREFNKVIIIGGFAHPYSQPNTVSEPFDSQGHCLQSLDAVSGLNWLLTWGTWDKYGPLKANGRGTNQSEDYELCRRVVADGYQVGCVFPHVVLHTGYTDTFGKISPGADVSVKLEEGIIIE